MDSGPTAAPGWYPDPHGDAGLRWWDGAMWSSHVHVDGVTIDEGQQPLKVLQWLSREPTIAFYERDPGTYGGQVDLMSADGRLLGRSGSDRPSGASGVFRPAIDIHLWAASGVRLASMRRDSGLHNAVHQVIDSADMPMGAFVRRHAASTMVEIETGAGVVGYLDTAREDTWLQSVSGEKLAHIQRTSQAQFLHAPRDTYVLQVLAPMPPWLFVFALLLPVEVDIRVSDRRRSAPRQGGSMGSL